MNRLFLILSILALTGCADERSALIADYVQTTSNVKNFSLVHIENMDVISASDSLDILEANYERNKKAFLQSYKDLMRSSVSINSSQHDRLSMQSTTSESGSLDNKTDRTKTINIDTIAWISELERRAKSGNAAALVYQQKELNELKTIQKLITKYKANPNIVLARTAKVTYSINDPVLEDVKHEVTKTFIFSPDNERIFDVVKRTWR